MLLRWLVLRRMVLGATGLSPTRSAARPRSSKSTGGSTIRSRESPRGMIRLVPRRRPPRSRLQETRLRPRVRPPSEWKLSARRARASSEISSSSSYAAGERGSVDCERPPWCHRACSSCCAASAATAATFAATEDSDTDFQSAYSTSPRGSYYESDNGHDKASIVPAEVDDYQQMKAVAENAEIPSHVNGHIRERASSSATAIAKVTVRRPTVGNALVLD